MNAPRLRSIHRTAALALSAFLLAGLAAHAAPAPKLQMIREQACPKDATGRCIAASQSGHFSVTLPAPFNEATILGSDEKGNPLYTYVLGCTTADKTKITVMAFWRPSEPTTAETLPKAVEALAKTGHLSHHRPVMVAGLQGETGSLEQSDSSAEIYLVVGNSALYQLIVEFPKSAEAEASREIPRVLASFATHGTPEPIRVAAP